MEYVKWIFCICIWMCLCMCAGGSGCVFHAYTKQVNTGCLLWTTVFLTHWGSKTKASYSLHLGLVSMQELEVELVSSGRTASDPNCWVISSGLPCYFLKTTIVVLVCVGVYVCDVCVWLYVCTVPVWNQRTIVDLFLFFHFYLDSRDPAYIGGMVRTFIFGAIKPHPFLLPCWCWLFVCLFWERVFLNLELINCLYPPVSEHPGPSSVSAFPFWEEIEGNLKSSDDSLEAVQDWLTV